MLRKLILLMTVIAVTVTTTMVLNAQEEQDSNILIAHAGGIIDNYSGTNSLEALQESVRLGYKYIEVDILKTTDNKFILAHDWEYMNNRVPLTANSPVEADVFVDYKIKNKYTPVTLELLLNFLDENPDIFIITDTKNMDYSSLKYISEQCPEYMSRLIPQVYLFEDYGYVKDMGYEKIIITLYAMPYEIKMSPKEIARQAASLGAFAITVPEALLNDEEYVKSLKLGKTNYFTHTINSVQRAEELFKMGINGVYTDTIKPSTQNDTEIENISEFDEKYADKINLLNDRILQFTNDERNLLKECLVYEVNEEIMINNGIAEFVYNEAPANSFIEHTSQNVYVPFYKTAVFLGAENITFNGEKKTFDFYYNGQSHEIPFNVADKNGKISLTIFCDIAFANEEIFTNIFDCKIIKTGENNRFIVVTKQDTDSDNSYEQIIRKLFY